MIPTFALLFLLGVLVGFLLPHPSTSEGSERSYAMIPILALILLLGVLAAVLPGLLAADDAELGYTLREPFDADAAPVRFEGYDPGEWDRPADRLVLVLEDFGPPLMCARCGWWTWTEEGAAFHVLMCHGEEV